jgi:uncharacterized membrane protein
MGRSCHRQNLDCDEKNDAGIIRCSLNNNSRKNPDGRYEEQSLNAINTLQAHAAELAGVLWLFGAWIGYSWFAKRRAKCSFCIASVLHAYRKNWMRSMLQRSNRISDAALLGNLERNASFLASTSLFVIAGVFTLLASASQVKDMIATVPFAAMGTSTLQLQFKILLLLLIHVYAFFTFTWSMRQYGFCAILLGAAPVETDPKAQGDEGENYVRHVAKVIDQAGISYNHGLRAYYFSLAVLAWLLNTPVFVLAVAGVVAILYGREFHSRTLKAMIQVDHLEQKKSAPCHK